MPVNTSPKGLLETGYTSLPRQATQRLDEGRGDRRFVDLHPKITGPRKLTSGEPRSGKLSHYLVSLILDLNFLSGRFSQCTQVGVQGAGVPEDKT